jgi:hypothetical protein
MVPRDDICVLCGISLQTRGPRRLCFYNSAEDIASDLAKGIHADHQMQLSLEETTSILFNVLSVDYDLWKMFPGIHDSSESDPEYCWKKDAVAVGHFDSTGGYIPCTHFQQARLHPTGDSARARRVCLKDATGAFTRLITEDGSERLVQYCRSVCMPSHVYEPGLANIWVHAPCFAYLQAWLDCRLSPRHSRPDHPLDLTAELYELVRSRKESLRPEGYLPCIDYYGSLGFQSSLGLFCYIKRQRNHCQKTAEAICAGARGEQLVPALLEDRQYWIFAEPYV